MNSADDHVSGSTISAGPAAGPLTARDQAALVKAAIKALDNSHPLQPANLRFGAAVFTASGNIYSAAVFWSATSTLTLHAEHAALAHAASHGERDILAVACVSTEDPKGLAFCHPCGICKQLIYESAFISKREIEVLMANQQGACEVRRISELVPYPWPAPASDN
jgi:cytidine deaminase